MIKRGLLLILILGILFISACDQPIGKKVIEDKKNNFLDISNEKEEFSEQEFDKSSNNMIKELDAYSRQNSPLFYDLDGDKKDEIILASWAGYDLDYEITGNTILVMDMNGNDKPGWPKNLFDPYFFDYGATSRLAVGDINGDGNVEIFSTVTDAVSKSKIYAFDKDGNEIFNTRTLPNNNLPTCPAIGDVGVNGKVVFPTLKECGNSHNNVGLYLVDENGNDVDGWPKTNIPGSIGECPAIVDIDNDDSNEVVVGSDSDWCFGGNYPTIYVFDENGNNKPGWPKNVQDVTGTDVEGIVVGLAFGDINNDGSNEVIFNMKASGNCIVAAYEGDGVKLWHKVYSSCVNFGDISLADLDNNGYLDIVFGEYYGVHALDKNGNELVGWPFENDACIWESCGNYGEPSFLDVDNDGKLEVFIYDKIRGIVYGIEDNGVEISGWSSGYVDFTDRNSAPLLNDFDCDGKVEMILISQGFIDEYMNVPAKMYLWKLGKNKLGAKQWQSVNFDNTQNQNFKEINGKYCSGGSGGGSPMLVKNLPQDASQRI